MKQGLFKITENKNIAPGVFKMCLAGDASAVTFPGQFVNIHLEGKYLRRPISVCDKSDDGLVIIYKTVGSGTEQMSLLKPEEELDILTGLGNGYCLEKAGNKPLLIGGGAGIPPLYWLAKELKKAGKDVTAILGFNKKEEIFYKEEFEALGCDVRVTTVDGSFGTKGFVTDAFPEEYTYFYTCGPGPMLKAVWKATETEGEFSFEERMGCGFGACMGCSIKTKEGFKRVCKDGPVFKKGEILWEE